MKKINPYLMFNGNAEEAFNFYKSVFGGEFTILQRVKETPEADKVPENEQEKIMHVALPIGEGNTLMASDNVASRGSATVQGTNLYISITTESEEETTNLFNKLSAGGKVEAPLEKTFWGSYFGMFTDKFGVKWMVDYEYDQGE